MTSEQGGAAALVQRLREAKRQLEHARDAWAQTIDAPSLQAGQQLTIDVLGEAADALEPHIQKRNELCPSYICPTCYHEKDRCSHCDPAALLHAERPRNWWTLARVQEFIGWLSADIPELNSVEVPILADSLTRFMAASASGEARYTRAEFEADGSGGQGMSPASGEAKEGVE